MRRQRITYWTILLFAVATLHVHGQVMISGSVKDAETREPLPYATVQLIGSTIGTTTGASGTFSLDVPDDQGKLVISFIGYRGDTVAISRSKLNILLRPDYRALKEVVVVSGTMKEVSKMNSPIPVEIYTPALFLKNPTPSIFESLGMVNGVQPQLNCNVCNTGDIHINGMEGPYTMVLIDGMPIVSSLSTVYGLSGIPNSMVKRIEVVKGPASTLYGSEAVAGLINIITKDPQSSPAFYADVSATSLQEYNADISTKWKIKNTTALLGINHFSFRNRLDVNHDNFTDLTLQDRTSVFHKWDLQRRGNRQASLAFRYVYEDRWGGELQWNRQYRGSDQVYGESIYTNRGELIGRYDLPSREKITLDYSLNYHLQDSYYGIVKYYAQQSVAFTQLRWSKQLGKHDLLIGLPFRYIFYDDNTAGTAAANQANQPMKTVLPGIFIQDEFKQSEKLSVLTGMRYDHHNEHGNIYSPRIALKFSPDKQNTLRFSTGNGFRVVNLFTEEHAALTGARQVIIRNALKPEQSWNMNLNYATTIPHRTGYIGLDGSVFYTYFTNKIVGDYITDPAKIIFDNLRGHAISKGITLNTDIAFTQGLKILTGITLMDVYQVSEDSLSGMIKKQQLFAPHVSGTYAISYSFDKTGLSFDLTGRINGPMRLPVVPNDERPERSPWYNVVNIQVTKTFNSGLSVYAGAKNLLNFMPKNPILRPFDPFNRAVDDPNENPKNFRFDTSYNYAPVQGIKGFAGVRYTLQ